MLWVGLFLLLAALVVFWLASRQRKATGLPTGDIIYADPGGWLKAEKPLYDPLTGLTGKPDFLVQQGETYIPVEVKSTSAPSLPYESHLLQLAAYCLLVERTYNHRPPYGILKYSNRTLRIEYSAELEQHLMDTLDQMRIQLRRGEADRSHEEPARCAHCGYRGICEQKL